MKRLDFRRVRDTTIVVLLYRALLSAWAAFISARFPDSEFEMRIALWPDWNRIGLGEWLHRLVVSPWMRYDAEYYIRIVERGAIAGDGTSSFHPLYPLLAKPFYWLGGNAPASLLLVSTIATIALGVIFSRYVARWHDETTARTATILLLFGPFGWLLLSPYTESTFLVFAVLSLWSMRERHWWPAAICGALATLTRQQGIALLLPLAWQMTRHSMDVFNAQSTAERVLGFGSWVLGLRARSIVNRQSNIVNRVSTAEKPVRHLGRDWLALGVIPLAYAAFSLYRVLIIGEWPDKSHGWFRYLAQWIVSPSSNFVVPNSHVAAPWTPFLESLRLISITPNPYHLWIDLLLGWAMIAVCIIGWRRLETSEKIYSGAIIVLSICFLNGPYIALPRHMLLAFPLFVIVAMWCRPLNALRTRIVLEIAAAGGLLLFSAYVRDAWVP